MAIFNLTHLQSFRAFSCSTADVLKKLRLLLSKGHLDEALSIFYTSNISQTEQTYAYLFHECARHNCLHHGQALHHHMLTNTHKHNSPSPGLYVTNHLINMYAKCEFLNYARQLFDEMPERNIVSWTALISGYAQHNRPKECFDLFSDMLTTDYRPNEFAYASVLTCCGGLDLGRQVHALALKTCFDAYTYVANALITMYSKNSSSYNHKFDKNADEAWMVFKNIAYPSLVTWNSMIAVFRNKGMWNEALNLFSLMRDNGIMFDRATLLSISSSISGVPKSQNGNVFTCLKYCSQLHCLAVKTSFILEIGVSTALTKAYADSGGEVADCRKLFLESENDRDIVSWTGFITIFAERDPEESLLLFSQLRHKDGLNPDRHTYSIVLKACAAVVTERYTLAIHSQIIKSGFENDTVLANALIHAYGRSGSNVDNSKKVFNEIEFRDTVSWNSMMKIYGLHGKAEEALKCFGKMNVEHDGTTFVALLSACSHAGMVDQGIKIFNSMTEIYGITPQLDHFACMVDILGRAGRVLEAQKLVNEMPMEPDAVVWSALLGACRKHGEIKLANLAAAKLNKLDPENSLGYVLMSNICCSAGSFSEAVDIRKQMDVLGVRKDPGLSWTEIGNRVKEFTSGLPHHEQGIAIRANLKKLVKLLKEFGYVPETGLVLHDLEEEDKEEELYYHSEKLALVYALMQADGLQFHGGVIRIVKNIRICVDCHNFMKCASEVVRKEIVVRDSNRFHHFKEAVCSCNDYW